jgi:hypothetical protein
MVSNQNGGELAHNKRPTPWTNEVLESPRYKQSISISIQPLKSRKALSKYKYCSKQCQIGTYEQRFVHMHVQVSNGPS